MRICSIHVSNFRALTSATLNNLRQIVVIAGQNGSGKSCLLDAIRLFKSTYGGYQPNELHQWFQESQIDINSPTANLRPLFNDIAKPLIVEMEIELSIGERKFLAENAQSLLESIHQLRALSVMPEQNRGLSPATRDRIKSTNSWRVEDDIAAVRSEANTGRFKGRVTILPELLVSIVPCIPLEVVFSSFQPENIGIIDYHGSNRHYSREIINNINVNLDSIEKNRENSVLYNYANKYNNVKSEMAALYVTEILAEKAGVEVASSTRLTETLKELFRTFFPDKEYLGPQPTPQGALEFPVKTRGGKTHDLNDLSSGEKEILYGYLRLRNSNPKDWVILIDEPELHLNPRLTRRLPDFYLRHLARGFNNQIWLVTHSDALLRDAVGQNDYSVFHLVPPDAAEELAGRDQARPLGAVGDLDSALIDLVGDLAAYSPGAKLVLFEGGGDSEFDRRMTAELFPDLSAAVNMISASNKSRVRGLHDLISEIASKGQLPFKVCSVVDKDSEESGTESSHAFAWDVYHIENYLLVPEFIGAALQDLNLGTIASIANIDLELIECARQSLRGLVRHRLCAAANRKLVGAINTQIDPGTQIVADDLARVIAASVERITKLKGSDLGTSELARMEADLRSEFEVALTNGQWRANFRGRDILRLFVNRNVKGANYESFRNLVLSRMRTAGYKPTGMAKVVDRIKAA